MSAIASPPPQKNVVSIVTRGLRRRCRFSLDVRRPAYRHARRPPVHLQRSGRVRVGADDETRTRRVPAAGPDGAGARRDRLRARRHRLHGARGEGRDHRHGADRAGHDEKRSVCFPRIHPAPFSSAGYSAGARCKIVLFTVRRSVAYPGCF